MFDILINYLSIYLKVRKLFTHIYRLNFHHFLTCVTSYDYNTCIYGASPSSQYKYPPNLKVCAKKRVVALADCEKVKFNWLMFGCFFFINFVCNKPPWDETAFQGLNIFFRYEQIISIAYLFEFTVFMTLRNFFQNFSNHSHWICSNFAIIEATRVFKDYKF